MRLRHILVLIVLALVITTAKADDGNPLKVSVLVASPGHEVYELEGHAGLRLVDHNGDWTVNWGLFDFHAPHFVYRFVKGRTDYMIGAVPTEVFLNQYRHEGRGVVEIPLRLTPEQAARVREKAVAATAPGHNVYRYNYVNDNCSTRPVALVESAVGQPITMSVPADWASEPEISFRDVMRYYHRYYPWYQFGIDLALGSGIDYPLSPRQLAFAPVLLPELLSTATVDGRPIASHPVTLVEAQPSETKPTPWPLTPLAVGIYVLAVSVAVTIGDFRRRKSSKWWDTILFGTYALAGCVLAFLVFVSTHEATSPNWLLFWLNPFLVVAAFGIWIKNGVRMVYCYHFVNFVALLLLACAWPWLKQEGNIAFVPLILADAIRSVSYIWINRCALKKREIN